MAVIRYEGRKNQTKLHQSLSLAPIYWANSRSTGKGTRYATEFHVFHDYIVDTAVIMSFGWRFAKHYGIPEKTENGYLVRDVVCLFEAKQSIADFKKDFGGGGYKGENPKGDLNWVVTPKGLVGALEIPEKWGLLQLVGGGLREIKKPITQRLPESELNRIGYEMLWKQGRRSQVEDRREIERNIV